MILSNSTVLQGAQIVSFPTRMQALYFLDRSPHWPESSYERRKLTVIPWRIPDPVPICTIGIAAIRADAVVILRLI